MVVGVKFICVFGLGRGREVNEKMREGERERGKHAGQKKPACQRQTDVQIDRRNSKAILMCSGMAFVECARVVL